MITVVCPIYNEEKYIARCIESIMEQDYPKDDMEVLFVDGMSTDHTRAIIEEYLPRCPYLRVIDNPQRIVPYAMNAGIKAAKGDVIIRLDAHALYPSNYFSELVRKLYELNADNVGAVCRTLPANDTPKCKAIASALSSAFGMGNSYFRIGAKEIKQVDTVPFGCYRKDVFDRIGLYDNDLVRNQDDELNARLIKHGGKIYLIPYIVVDYFARDTIKKTGKMFYQYGLYKPLVNKKLGSPATVRQFFPVAFVLGLIFGLIAGLLNCYLLMAYLFVIALYLLLAVVSSLRSSKSLKQVYYQVVTYFTIHLNYGWGYLAGLYRILAKKNFSAKVNR
ncbi:MAG TPA: glycosyltransferase family 2 protein [Candidatus Avibacteroides excrementipullorum]|nr:glycosyltransferase family 2 protein [Candidatus Avibacteroides excrementipullorum]